MRSTTPRICPQCGATNTGRSLFCAECGADLNKPPDPTMTRPLGSNATGTMITGSDQQTEQYTPSWNQTWSGKDRDEGSSGAQTGLGGSAMRTPVTPITTTQPAPASPLPTASEPETSTRGFYLGLIAILLIIAIALALGWLALFQPNL